jgi:two-component system sensor histidine kinase BarA
LREALARGDAAAAERVAHKLKGAVSNFAAPAAAAVAGQVEKYARAGDLSRVRKAVRGLERELERLRPVLTAFCSEVSQ